MHKRIRAGIGFSSGSLLDDLHGLSICASSSACLSTDLAHAAARDDALRRPVCFFDAQALEKVPVTHSTGLAAGAAFRETPRQAELLIFHTEHLSWQPSPGPLDELRWR
jgi:hypothetical protein